MQHGLRAGVGPWSLWHQTAQALTQLTHQPVKSNPFVALVIDSVDTELVATGINLTLPSGADKITGYSIRLPGHG